MKYLQQEATSFTSRKAHRGIQPIADTTSQRDEATNMIMSGETTQEAAIHSVWYAQNDVNHLSNYKNVAQLPESIYPILPQDTLRMKLGNDCRQPAGAIGLPLLVDREYDVTANNARQRY